MSKPKLHFAHANSYPAGVYRQFFALLGEHFDIQSVDMHAHNPDYPVTDGWPHLVDEYIRELTTRYNEPVILVGHSLGGMLSLMVAHKRPDLVRCVVMLDAPVVGGWRAFAWRMIKLLGRAYVVPPAKFSIRRRNVWPSVDAAYQHFAAKDLFAAWAPGVLGDYMDSGLKPHPEGVQLRFTRENETAVYATLPHHLPQLLRGGYPVPIGFIGGDNSWETSQSGHQHTKALVGSHFRIVPGGHLFPMESPAVAAEATKQMIDELLAVQSGKKVLKNEALA
ncbi:alpha/beta fold hydrolase [Pseudoduganella sp. FT25W]|uniref:Alpha/beta fold hydrolase n=1 Tax=Duganella alba TaxID=2666081 RepID=A0A6L5QJC9_9BURK|nr:alpha/beta fold hydrolase [Duganella alba]MRX17530.1 alpha/beta fold hydrolase [Duganella alba]